MNLTEHLRLSIEKAEKEKSKLDPEVFTTPGYTSVKIRHLLNNLGSYSKLHYLEVGVHRGATFVATNYKNKLASSVAVDNWSEFNEDGSVKNDFEKYCSLFLKPGYKFYEQDAFTVTKEQLPNPVNFYLYDGGHSYDAHVKALTHFYQMLDQEFIFLVDDYNWPEPQKATEKVIEALGLKVIYRQHLVDGWWNGLLATVLQKP